MTRKIDWDQFKGNVRSFTGAGKDMGIPDHRAISFRDHAAGYVEEPSMFNPDPVTAEDVERWSRPSDDQPTPEMRDALVAMMEVRLRWQDRTHFFESIEGDYCAWDVNLAARLERDEPLVDTDWYQLWGVYQQLWSPDYDGDPENEREVRELVEAQHGAMDSMMDRDGLKDAIYSKRLC